jgi:hypothetical protein
VVDQIVDHRIITAAPAKAARGQAPKQNGGDARNEPAYAAVYDALPGCR